MKLYILPLAIGLASIHPTLANDSMTVDELVDGLIMVDGNFHSEYSYEPPQPQVTGEEIDPAALRTTFLGTPVNDRRAYLATLTGAEKRALFLFLEGEEKDSLVDVLAPRTYTREEGWTPTTARAAYTADRDVFQGMLDVMSDSEMVDALNSMPGWPGPVALGEWSYYGEAEWGTLEALNLSGRNLTGLVTAGRNLRGSNLAGSTISKEQLEAADWTSFVSGLATQTVLSGLDLSDVDITGWRLTGADLSNTGLSQEQILSVHGTGYGTYSGMAGASLRGLNLAGMPMSPFWNWMNVDFRDTGLTGASLNGAQHLSGSNLSGLDLSEWNPVQRKLSNIVMDNATITPEQLTVASSIKGVSLKNTGISKAQLDAALIAAGKDPNELIYQTWQPVYGWPPHPEGGYWVTHDPPLYGAFNTSTVIFE